MVLKVLIHVVVLHVYMYVYYENVFQMSKTTGKTHMVDIYSFTCLGHISVNVKLCVELKKKIKQKLNDHYTSSFVRCNGPCECICIKKIIYIYVIYDKTGTT